MISRRFLLTISFFLFVQALLAQSVNKTYGSGDIYFTMKLGGGPLFSPSSHGNLHFSIPYTSVNTSGITNGRLSGNWALPYYDVSKSWGSHITFELGNYRTFMNISIGGNMFATTMSGGLGLNFYVPINCGGPTPHCWVIKPSINVGLSQSFPFNQRGDETHLLGNIDNENKSITIDGYTFLPTYQTKSSGTVNAKTVNVYYMENNTVMIPQISFGNNNYQRLLNFSLYLGYFIPVNYKRGIGISQDQQTLHIKYLSSTNPEASFDEKPLTNMPSIADGFFVGASVGLNFSRETLNSYGANNLKRQRPDSEMVCHCGHRKAHVHRERKSKKKVNKNALPMEKDKKDSPNSLGW